MSQLIQAASMALDVGRQAIDLRLFGGDGCRIAGVPGGLRGQARAGACDSRIESLILRV